MTDPKTAYVKGGVQPPQPKTRMIIFSILMVGVLISLLALYKIARPFVENHSNLTLALIAGIIFAVLAYAMAIKGGVQPPQPKKLIDSDGDIVPPPSSKIKAKPVRGGIDPPVRKTP